MLILQKEKKNIIVVINYNLLFLLRNGDVKFNFIMYIIFNNTISILF